MSEEKLSKNGARAAIFLQNYGKRMLEGKYTKFFDETALGKKLKSLGYGKKLTVEAVLYGFAALLNEKLPEGAVGKKVLKDILLDAPSEISKRMLNGDLDPKETKECADDFLTALLKADSETLTSFLKWVETLNEDEAGGVIEKLSSFSPEDVKNFLALSPETKNLFLKSIKKEKNPIEGFSKWFQKELSDLKKYREERKGR